MTDEAVDTRPFNSRLFANLADWFRTGVVVVTVLSTGLRWTSTVDSRLNSIEDKIAGQQTVIEHAVGETTQHANMAVQAARRAEDAVVRAESAVSRAEDAVTENQQAQKKVIAATDDNRRAIEKQGTRVTDFKTEMKRSLDSFEWRIRMLEEQNRKALEKK